MLDPTTPPEGKPRRAQSRPDGPPSPLEERGAELGIRFTRGRTITSNSHLALEAAEFAAERGDPWPFHKAMFRAYFEDLADIGSVDTVVRVGERVGLDAAALREALEMRRYREQADEGIARSQQIGVSAVPTFVINGRYGIVGAQDQQTFRQVIERVRQLPPESEA